MNKNEKGFSLIEVIASIVIISIVLLSFFQLFIQSNKTAVANNEKLVVINLADAQLERLKINPTELTGLEGVPINNFPKKYNLTPIQLNNKTYTVQVEVIVSSNDKTIGLYNIVVTAIAPNGKTQSSVEGYISYD